MVSRVMLLTLTAATSAHVFIVCRAQCQGSMQFELCLSGSKSSTSAAAPCTDVSCHTTVSHFLAFSSCAVLCCAMLPGVFDLRPALEAAAAGGILNARQLEGVATSMESAFDLKAAVAATAAGTGDLQHPHHQQQQQQYLYPCLVQLASGIQERELQTLQAIRSCIR